MGKGKRKGGTDCDGCVTLLFRKVGNIQLTVLPHERGGKKEGTVGCLDGEEKGFWLPGPKEKRMKKE